MSPTPVPPNPDDLTTEHAAALVEQIEQVYAYMARLARRAADLAEGLTDDAWRLAEGASDDERGAYEADALEVADMADYARLAAFRATDAADVAEGRGPLAHAAEDTEPLALAEVAVHLADTMAAALEALSGEVPL